VIVSDPDDLREIVKGRQVEVRQNGDLPDLGTVHPVQASVGRKATCHVVIVDVWEHIEGGYVATVKRGDRQVVEALRLLRAGGGYTSDPSKTTKVGGEPEPECVPKDWVDPGAELRVHQQAELDRATRERLSLGERLDSLFAESDARHIDIHNRRRRILRELQLLERDLGRELTDFDLGLVERGRDVAA
jgi:hypothetical protein